MPVYKLSETDAEALFKAFEKRKNSAQGLSSDLDDELNRKVARIVLGVAEGGESALLEYTRQFDNVAIPPGDIRVSKDEIKAAFSLVPKKLVNALKIAAERIRAFQKSIMLSAPPSLEEEGRRLCLRYQPVDAAGICVPGASASLASSVLMNVIPADVAGVERIVMITPPDKDGNVSPARLAAAHIAGVDEIYRVFGAQAVAALAFGTESIAPVDFIAGPGNAFVAAAKKWVFGHVGIDMIAGPSEVVVVADETAPPDWAAAELLSQGEHTGGSAVLVSDSFDMASETLREVEKQGAALNQWVEVKNCLERYGCVLLCSSFDECIETCNRLAPEHLVIMCEKPETAIGNIRHAGAIFVGPHTPVAVGDYIAGPSHTLPTGTTARFTGGLTANHFLKSNSIIRYNSQALAADADDIITMAEAEGLPAHANSVRARVEKHRNC